MAILENSVEAPEKRKLKVDLPQGSPFFIQGSYPKGWNHSVEETTKFQCAFQACAQLPRQGTNLSVEYKCIKMCSAQAVGDIQTHEKVISSSGNTDATAGYEVRESVTETQMPSDLGIQRE